MLVPLGICSCLVSSAHFAAHLSKEIAIVILPIALLWYLTALICERRSAGRERTNMAAAYLLASLGSVIGYTFLRVSYLPSGWQLQGYSGNYTLTLEQIKASVIRWTGWLIRDYLYLLPLLIGAAITWITNRERSGLVWLLSSAIWTGGFIVIFLPWYYMVEYFILPAALGLSAMIGVCAAALIGALRTGPLWRRSISGFTLGLSFLLLTPSLLAGISNARIQLAVDAVNTRMLHELVASAPPNATVIVNIQDPNEYVEEIALHLEAYHARPDLGVEAFAFPETLPRGTYYILEPKIKGQPRLTVRMGVYQPTQETWNQSLQTYFASHPGWQEIGYFRQGFTRFNLHLLYLFCPFVQTRSFCAQPSPVFDRAFFEYGWTIYRLDVP